MPNIKSSKAKGRKLQNYVRDRLRQVFVKEWTKFPKLEDDDIKSEWDADWDDVIDPSDPPEESE